MERSGNTDKQKEHGHMESVLVDIYLSSTLVLSLCKMVFLQSFSAPTTPLSVFEILSHYYSS